MNYGAIKKHDVANGLGVRVSLFVSGCTHHCPECFNEEAWDFAYGQPFTKAAEEEIIAALKPEYIRGFSLLGGEPFEPANQEVLVTLIRRIRSELPGKTIWMYTGFIYDKDLIPGGRRYTAATDEILDNIDILVDGPYVEELRNITLKFRGSENQRILDMKKTRAAGKAAPVK